jgi:type II secretory pathway pseudopilin PulG
MADRFRSAVSNSLGITLVETVIALAMFSSAGTAVLLGVSAAHTSSDRVNASAVAENLARNQMEYVNSLAYVAPPGNYASVADDVGLNVSIPTGFAVSAGTETYVADDGYTGSIEKVIVTVTRDSQSILVLESLRSGP